MTKKSTFDNNKQNGSSGKGKGNDQTYQAWRYENPENKATKEVRSSTIKWCKNDWHDQPMWYGRKNCLNRADYPAVQKKKNAENESKPDDHNDNSKFKISLADMTSPEDFAVLQELFKALKD